MLFICQGIHLLFCLKIRASTPVLLGKLSYKLIENICIPCNEDP